MARQRKSEVEKKLRINITLDKSVYEKLQKKHLKISSINQLLKESTRVKK